MMINRPARVAASLNRQQGMSSLDRTALAHQYGDEL
jgi:hypothetical protein